ncbi:hypothetical protein [Cupriavidus sp. USMAHM13]|nr:hypothetical protein [Cupriavidus sp. USMAHM13]
MHRCEPAPAPPCACPPRAATQEIAKDRKAGADAIVLLLHGLPG